MASNIKTKESFGTVKIDHVGPNFGPDAPTAFNIHLGFEEALKLHFGLGQLLAKVNSYNRATRAGRRSGANLCLYTKQLRFTINEGRVLEKNADNVAGAEPESEPDN